MILVLNKRRKSKEEERKTENSGKIELPKDVLEFMAENAKLVYEVEEKRQNSILEQTGRLLVFETLISAAFYTVVPMVLDVWGDEKVPEWFWLLVLGISLLLILVLILTLVTQWRFEYKGMPNPVKLKEKLNNMRETDNLEKLKSEYKDKYITAMSYSLKSKNDVRTYLIKMVVIILLAMLLLIICGVLYVMWR